jgi:hypothetical protein
MARIGRPQDRHPQRDRRRATVADTGYDKTSVRDVAAGRS